jgi:hypothetical protein
MRSLSAHLRAQEDHARLPFRPDCPRCRRERLSGGLSSEGVVSQRAQAALAAGVLALSTAAPAAALAAEPDHEQQGAAAPGQTGGSDLASSPDFDPGGSSTDVLYDAPAVPQVPASAADSDDADALDQEPVNDVDAPVADPGDGAEADEPRAVAIRPAPSAAGAPDQRAAPTHSAPPGAAPPTAGAAPESSPAGRSGLHARKPRDAAPRPAAKDDVAGGSPVARAPVHRSTTGGPASPPSPASAGQARPTPQGAVALADADAAAPVERAHVVRRDHAAAPGERTRVVGRGDAAAPGERTHVVRRGESLWSIARDVLGGTASTIQVAREVNRLWELNKDRIGTGDRNLLVIGTRLRLR